MLLYTTARTLVKLCGKILSTIFALGNIVQLKTRRLYKVIDFRNNVQCTAYESLSEEESEKSSTWREISAIEFTLKAFVHLLKNSSVLWKTDNYDSTFIVNSGSSKDDLQKTAGNIFYFCKENSITLKVMWIPREESSSVYRLGEIINHDDWRTTKPFFEILNNSRDH